MQQNLIEWYRIWVNSDTALQELSGSSALMPYHHSVGSLKTMGKVWASLEGQGAKIAETLQICCLHERWLLFWRQSRAIFLQRKCRGTLRFCSHFLCSFQLLLPKTWCPKVSSIMRYLLSKTYMQHFHFQNALSQHGTTTLYTCTARQPHYFPFCTYANISCPVYPFRLISLWSLTFSNYLPTSIFSPHLLMSMLLGIALKALVNSGFLLHLLFFCHSESIFSCKWIKLAFII